MVGVLPLCTRQPCPTSCTRALDTSEDAQVITVVVAQHEMDEMDGGCTAPAHPSTLSNILHPGS